MAQIAKRLGDFLVLGFQEQHLCVDVFELVLEDFDVVFGGPAIVLNLRLLSLLVGLVHLDLLDFSLELGDGVGLCVGLLSQHLLRFPMGIRQELENLHTQK